ncbi:hypothetical protein BY996DRAFT_6426155 [Phakopsora pachyrhizi]|nr:hypothetical protein BY996DRAFT_6426155 [Phakopsora pachyrhizi]
MLSRFTVIYSFVFLALLGLSSGHDSQMLPLDLPVTDLGNSASEEVTSVASKTISPRHASVALGICLDLSIKLLGLRVLDFTAVARLGAFISKNGISADQLTIVQASLISQLDSEAATATNAYSCRVACKMDTCQSYKFDTPTRKCALTPVKLTKTSRVIAQVIANLSLHGNTHHYCSLCPCPPKSSKGEISIQPTSGTPSTVDGSHECIDTQEELTSCGGCTSIGDGLDCTKIEGVVRARCNRGICEAYRCDRGFKLTDVTCTLQV